MMGYTLVWKGSRPTSQAASQKEEKLTTLAIYYVPDIGLECSTSCKIPKPVPSTSTSLVSIILHNHLAKVGTIISIL